MLFSHQSIILKNSQKKHVQLWCLKIGPPIFGTTKKIVKKCPLGSHLPPLQDLAPRGGWDWQFPPELSDRRVGWKATKKKNCLVVWFQPIWIICAGFIFFQFFKGENKKLTKFESISWLVGGLVEPPIWKICAKSNWITFQSGNGEIEKYLRCHHLDEFMSFKPTLHNKNWAENQFHAIKLHDMKKMAHLFWGSIFWNYQRFKKNTYVFLQLRCLVFFNSFGMRIADFQRYMKYKNIMHGLMHAVLFGGVLTYLRLDWHAFLWTKKRFQWQIQFFSGPPSVWEWVCDVTLPLLDIEKRCGFHQLRAKRHVCRRRCRWSC